ncbi:MAG: cytochrome c maturation protein CcmE [Nevskiaceae bacterium]|nr:MAG: cytochrome c maturation protein CcmE [Nevskiaceae bacterium]TBR74157.1 MAG: cytochrome c maturation protein CcmE [Nevskiaceae bacterium]
MTRRRRRLAAVSVLVLGVGAAAALALTAFNKNITYFYTPTDLYEQHITSHAVMDLGGLVQKGSIVHGAGMEISFIVTDCTRTIPVRYTGVLPDLFRDGQGVVATGRLNGDGSFVASRILAKHDSSYMPENVAARVKQADAEGRRNCGEFKSMQPTSASVAPLVRAEKHG